MCNPTRAIVLAAVLVLQGCGDKTSTASTPMAPSAPAPAAPKSTEPPIQVAEVQLQTVGDRVIVPATVLPDQHRVAKVAPRVSGRVLEVLIHVGEPVKRGQTLATLDSVDVGEARLAFEQANTQRALAEADYARISKLVDEEVLPRKEALRATADRDKAIAAATTAASRLRMLGVNPDAAGRTGTAASSFALSAPLPGIVLDKTAVIGELATPDKPIFVVGDLSVVWVEANLSDREIARVRIGAPADVTLDAYPGEIFRGKLTYLANSVDPVTRTLLARVEVPNVDLRLKPQMFAQVAIASDAKGEHLTVPVSAVVLVQGEPSVFVQKNAEFEHRPVETGATFGDRIEIRRGLSPGERIAVSDVFQLKAKLLKSQISDEH